MFFNHCKYCYYIRLFDCKLVGNLGLEVFKNQMDSDSCTRMEALLINNCQFDEKNRWIMIEIVVNIETVKDNNNTE